MGGGEVHVYACMWDEGGGEKGDVDTCGRKYLYLWGKGMCMGEVYVPGLPLSLNWGWWVWFLLWTTKGGQELPAKESKYVDYIVVWNVIEPMGSKLRPLPSLVIAMVVVLSKVHLPIYAIVHASCVK